MGANNRPCKICQRTDVEELDSMLRAGQSCRQIALRRDINPRVLLQHFKRHRNGLNVKLRRAKASHAVAKALSDKVSVLAESHALLERVRRVLAHAEADGSHRLTLEAVREAKGLLDTIGRANGELSPQGNAVVVQVGVSVERAKAAVELVDEAATLTDAQIADRAEAALRMYDSSNPHDRRVRLWESDGATPQEG